MNHEKYRLLVVDDEETTRRSLADILRLEGYLVETAHCGEAALQRISEQSFDLILLDLRMPGMDGLQVLRDVTGMEATYDTPISPQIHPTVILLTAHGSLESAIEALRHGAQDYLLKPASPTHILKSVAQGLRAREAQIEMNTRLQQLENASLQGDRDARHLAGLPGASLSYKLPGDITIDLARREIQAGVQTIKLTPTENKLMKVFLENPSRVFSHRELVLRVQGYDTKDWEAPEVLRPLVSRLRRKLINLPGGANWISSVRGTGYVCDIHLDGEY